MKCFAVLGVFLVACGGGEFRTGSEGPRDGATVDVAVLIDSDATAGDDVAAMPAGDANGGTAFKGRRDAGERADAGAELVDAADAGELALDAQSDARSTGCDVTVCKATSCTPVYEQPCCKSVGGCGCQVIVPTAGACM